MDLVCMDALRIGAKSEGMLVFCSRFTSLYSLTTMTLKAAIIAVFLLGLSAFNALAQNPPAGSQEISDIDGQPVLIKHLPDYENVQTSAVFGTEKAGLESTGRHQVLKDLEFPSGTEYVSADYPQGRLLIIEYTNPQSSADADTRIQRYAADHPDSGFVYKRIGNYNAFVFGAADPVGAGALLDQVKYEKTIQWLGEDPYLLKRLERYMVSTSRDIMISTVLVIVLGLATSIVAGIAAGFIFFRFRDQKRASRAAFSDAGGLTRLNLDGLSE